jgi:hypothetical protein
MTVYKVDDYNKAPSGTVSWINRANRRALQADGTMHEYQDEQLVSSSQSERQEIIDWCAERNMDVDLLWAGTLEDGTQSIWGIKDEEHKVMFALRWS